MFAASEERAIEAVVPAKAERPPKRGTIPVRRFKLDARNRLVRCPAGRFPRPHGKPDSDGFQHCRARVPDCRACRLRQACFSPAMKRRAILLHKDHPALLRARRKYARWGGRERALYRSHRIRVEGFQGEAKTWHGLARAVRRGLANVRIQAYLTAAAVNLKRLATALLLPLLAAVAGLLGSPRGLSRETGAPALHRVGLPLSCRAVSASCPLYVERHGAVARFRDGPHLAAPGLGRVGDAVAEQDGRSLPLLDHVERRSVRLHLRRAHREQAGRLRGGRQCGRHAEADTKHGRHAKQFAPGGHGLSPATTFVSRTAGTSLSNCERSTITSTGSADAASGRFVPD